jgi:hypothetical protein
VNLRDIESFCSLDWGWNAPGCVLWWLALNDGHYHIAKEWKFQQKNAFEVRETIKRETKALGVSRLRYVVCDPAIKQKTGAGRGESIFETLSRTIGNSSGLPMRAGDNDRMLGWARCHELLQEAPDGTPWLTIEPSCRYLIRSIAGAVSHPKDPDDVDTNSDDHALDAWRYGAMSRPSPSQKAGRPPLPRNAVGNLLRDVMSRPSVPVVGATMVR